MLGFEAGRLAVAKELEFLALYHVVGGRFWGVGEL